ncbi:unnamed protein product, partial [marine sediment metagenome]
TRAMIRVTLPDTTDEEAIEVKKKIEEAVKEVEDAEVEITILAR